MAKYIVLDSKFNPTSFKDMIAPYLEYFLRMDKMLEKNEELELATELAKWMFDLAYAGEDTNPWLEYNKLLEEYADYASKPIDVQDYINKGTSLRKQYVRDIEKMNTAYKLYSADKELREKEMSQDPTRVYNDLKDFNLRTYYDNLNHSVESVSGKHLASNIANKAKTKNGAYRSNTTGNISGDPSSKLLIQHFGENPNDVLDVENAVIKWSQNPTEPIVFSGNNSKAKLDLANIIINEVKDYKDWKPESFQKLVRDAVVGIYDAIDQDKTQVIANKEYAEEQARIKEEQAYRKELLKSLQEEYEGDTHQTTSLIFSTGNVIEDFSDYINDDGKYLFLYKGNSPEGKVVTVKTRHDENLRPILTFEYSDANENTKMSNVAVDPKVYNFFMKNMDEFTYNNLSVKEAQEYFNKLINEEAVDAALIDNPYWNLNLEATKGILQSISSDSKLAQITGYDFGNNKYKEEGDFVKRLDLSTLVDEEKHSGKLIMGKDGTLMLNIFNKYYKLPSNIISTQLKESIYNNFIEKDKEGRTLSLYYELLYNNLMEQANREVSSFGVVSNKTIEAINEISEARTKLSKLLNDVGNEINTYTGTRNSNTK